MSDNEEAPAAVPKKSEGQVSLTQMLKVLDKDVATTVEKRLKKLSKKKGFKAVVNEQEAAQLNRRAAYDEVVQEISKWEPVVEYNRQANLSFPLDVEPDNLPTTAESISNIKPRNDIEREVQLIIDENKAAIAKEREQKKTEERYQKAISAEEAKERHLELQRTRVRLSDYAAKMRRQNKIKSKSYHRLLKQERIRKHLKRVESNKDALMDEIERLQKIRAQERATLKHKNTGKWAKHAKFRAKYDEEARKLMLEQIGIASKRLEKPVMPDSDSEVDEDSVSTIDEDEDQNNGSDNDASKDRVDVIINETDKNRATSDQLIISSDLISDRASRKRKKSIGDGSELVGDGDNLQSDDDDEEDEQRKLMSEAFADDDVVGEFQKAKDQIADEEQPKDINKYLPGWNDWAGPGTEVNERRKEKFIKKAKKIDRKDESLSNVIISERANDSIKELQPKQLPRGIRSDDHLKKTLSKPITATFTDQSSYRDSIQPKVVTRLGARIEPINKRILSGEGSKAKWA